MTEYEDSPERRSGRVRDIEVIVARQAEWLTEELIINPTEAALFKDGFTLRSVADEKLYCLFPARITDNKSGDKHTLWFDQPTVEHLVDTFAQSYKVTESELIELYVGTSIAAHLLSLRIREKNRVRVQRMSNILIDPGPILESMRTTNVIPESQRWDAIQSIMQSQDTRIGNINVLRFAFGMIYMQPEMSSRHNGAEKADEIKENRMMNRFREGLVLTIQNKPVYQKMGEFFGRHVVPTDTQDFRDSVDNGEFLGDKVFADAMGEFELAACFPMHWQELNKILDICK